MQPLRDYASARAGSKPSMWTTRPRPTWQGGKAWAQLVEDVRHRRRDHILVWKLDRASGACCTRFTRLEDLQHHGVGSRV